MGYKFINGYNPQWQNSAEMTALEILSGSYIFDY